VSPFPLLLGGATAVLHVAPPGLVLVFRRPGC